ncbi:chorismate mutase [Peptoniphilus equinus]|uniref:Chorismate mutase n=1 Tax=Peptoniphilus equinus TaxID=3016343 RepID=A0ABY7QS78_9FIRM|nr:chorismate mutase [Peptoniphilus equinus]WBW49656.1 chorismate mutase [Peptoniphilus equinus]
MELKDYRDAIDEIDKEMTALFERRMNVVKAVGDYKREHDIKILDKSREEKVLDTVCGYLHNTDYTDALRKFYQYLMDISKMIQE